MRAQWSNPHLPFEEDAGEGGEEGEGNRANCEGADEFNTIPLCPLFNLYAHITGLLRNENECLCAGFTRRSQAVRQVFHPNLKPVNVCDGIHKVSFCCHSYRNVTVSIGSWWKSDVGLFFFFCIIPTRTASLIRLVCSLICFYFCFHLFLFLVSQLWHKPTRW